MARFARVKFAAGCPDLKTIGRNRRDTGASVREFFAANSPEAQVRFAGYSPREIEGEMSALLRELDLSASLNVLAALEAAFRVDYLQRCYRKRKDELSRSFRKIYAEKGNRASLEDDIFEAWKAHSGLPAGNISDLIGAFKFRHWLAHGRYWDPKLGRDYDFDYLYILAEAVLESLPLEGALG